MAEFDFDDPDAVDEPVYNANLCHLIYTFPDGQQAIYHSKDPVPNGKTWELRNYAKKERTFFRTYDDLLDYRKAQRSQSQ